MDFFKTALQAAEKAAAATKEASQRGLVLVEGAADQAAKKLTTMNLHEKIGAGMPKGSKTSSTELAGMGITEEYMERLTELHFSTFRDFPDARLLDKGGESEVFVLTPWQARHAVLVCTTVKQIDELRFMLCPKYMTDEHFWHVYFSLMKPHLPVDQSSLPADKPLGSTGAGDHQDGSPSFLGGLKSQLQSFNRSLQSAARGATATVAGAEEGVELGSTHRSATLGNVRDGGAEAAAGRSHTAEATQEPIATAGLDVDPDLEAYLQVAMGDAGDASGEHNVEQDMDLDAYLQELTAGSDEEEQGGEGEDGEKGHAKQPAAEKKAAVTSDKDDAKRE